MANDENKSNRSEPSLTTTSVHASTAAPNQSMRPAPTPRTGDKSQTSDQSREGNHTTTSQIQEPSHHPPPRPRHNLQRHVVGVGRLNARIPSAKGLYKPHGSNAPRLNHRRNVSSSPDRFTTRDGTQAHGHRRVQSEAKLSRDSSVANLRRNKSQVEVQKRPKSPDRHRRSPSDFPAHAAKSSAKSQVHFDLGTDDQDDDDDEWVDASASASPYLSRRGSMASGQSSAKPGCSSAGSSRPQTPGDARDDATGLIRDQENGPRRDSEATENSRASPPHPTAVDPETAQRREYLTTRLLQRTPTQGAPPMMTADTALVSRNRSPDPSKPRSALTHMTFNDTGLAATGSSDGAELTSHFVGVSSSGGATQDTPSYQTSDVSRPNSRRSHDTTLRPASSQTQPSLYNDDAADDHDGSALAPRKARRSAPPAQESRIQQKLNLQRASSAIEPGQSGGGGMGLGNMGMGMGMGRLGMGAGMGMAMGPVGATPFVGVAGAGYDGSTSRDPRVAKQLERTGMEYLSVRRYQNPVLRSLNRIARMDETTKTQRIPAGGRNGVANLPGSPAVNGHKTPVTSAPPSRPGTAHSRQTSLGREAAVLADGRVAVTPRAQSIRTLHSVGDGGSSLDTRLSGSSLVGGEDEEGNSVDGDSISTILRTLWDKNELSTSQD